MRVFLPLCGPLVTYIVALLLITAGCATRSPSTADSGSLVGKRMEEVVRQLGRPTQTVPLDNGEKIWIYSYPGQPGYVLEFGLDRHVRRVSETK